MEFLTIRKAATRSGVPEFRIRQMVKQNQVPGFYAGTRYLVNIDAFMDVLKEMCAPKITSENEPGT